MPHEWYEIMLALLQPMNRGTKQPWNDFTVLARPSARTSPIAARSCAMIPRLHVTVPSTGMWVVTRFDALHAGSTSTVPGSSHRRAAISLENDFTSHGGR